MNKPLCFALGFIVGAGSGIAGAFLFTKKQVTNLNKEVEYLNKELNGELASKYDTSSDEIEPEEEIEEEVDEQPIPDLAAMANKVKKEEGEKLDYTKFSKSDKEEEKEAIEEKNQPKEGKGEEKEVKTLRYVDDEYAYSLKTHKGYHMEELTLFNDGILSYDYDNTYDYDNGGDSVVEASSLGIDLSKLENDQLYAVDDNEGIIYAITKIDMSFKDEQEEEKEEDEQS